MTYRNWNQRADLASIMRWYRVDNIITYVDALRNWILTADARQQTPPRLEPSAPVSQDRRFPSSSYVCEAIGGWTLRLDRLALTLLLLRNPARLERASPHSSMPGEGELAVLGTIDDMLREVELYETVFTRESFENRYELQWDPGPTSELSAKAIIAINNINANK